MPRWLSLFRRPPDPEPRPAWIPEGQRVYAIGDVHGRLDLLMGLIGRIKEDDRRRADAETHIVMLGDLIDRGPQSAQVIEYLRVHQQGFAQFHFICGNHEEAMLASIAPNAHPEEIGWLGFGGRETMASYGASEELFAAAGPELAAAMRALVPDSHIAFIGGFRDHLTIGDYLFVHAGIRPGLPLNEQLGEDLRWIRSPFLEDRRDHGMMIVHGHSISTTPDMRHNRIGIDTGAYKSGVLTAMGMEADERWLLEETANG